jgi:protein-arginine kinase activator protein McsA
MKIRLTEDGRKAFEANGKTGWQYTDAVLLTKCPKCNAEKEHYCESPSWRKIWAPHSERLSLVAPKPTNVSHNLQSRCPNCNRNFQQVDMGTGTICVYCGYVTVTNKE